MSACETPPTSCCGPPAEPGSTGSEGTLATPIGGVPRVATILTFADRLGAWKVRWAIGRMSYRVEPGLYAVGSPTPESPVLLSANYKLSFDRLRSQLGGRDAWLLVLDTKGINVWCAAGKGTFGTDEIVARVEAARLAEVVGHRTLVCPQLGAPGVAAHEVKRRCGFRVVYGPVRVEDLPAFLDAGMEATPAMRRVRFPLRDRLAVVPVELVMWAKWLLAAIAAFQLVGGLGAGGYSSARAATVGTVSALLLVTAYLAGLVAVPALLPWVPGRAFSLKGAVAGALAAGIGIWALRGALASGTTMAAWGLILPAAASFLAMNFTGASTYTSLSGVRREMRVAIPLQLAAAAGGVALWVVGRFV